MNHRIKAFSYFLILVVVTSGGCKVQKINQMNSQPIYENREGKSSLNVQSPEFQSLFLEGVKLKTLGNIDEAVKLFSRCLEIDPNSSSALFEISNIHVLKGDFQSSMIMLEKAVALNPENQYYKLLLSKIYQQNKLFEKAADLFESLSNQFPDNIEYPLTKAVMLSQADKDKEALAYYDLLEKKLGAIEPIILGKQAIYLKMGNKEASYNEIKKIISLNKDEPKYYGLLADMYLADSLYDNALENYDKILELSPDDGFVHFSLANYYMTTKDFEKAYQQILIGFKNSELDLETKTQMFLLITQTNGQKISEDQQVELIRILIDKHIDDERPRALLAEYYIGKKLFKEAREEIYRVLDINKGNYDYWERLLFIDNDLLDWDALFHDSEDAIKYNEEQPLFYLLKAVALIQKKSYDAVLPLLDSAEDYAKDNPKILSQVLSTKADTYYKLKRYEEAFKMYEKVIESDPQNYLAMNNYSYYLSLKSEKLDIAEKLSGFVVQKNPNNATYLDTYAWVLFKRKDYQLAKFYIESALSQVTEDNPVLIEHYGDILYFIGDKESAFKQWEKSLKMGNVSKELPEKIKRKIYIESKEE